ncbi:MAG: pyrophosphohydrolase related protein [Cytophagaceae bacterium]|jgi:8-oxo-dGTP pyrophosphatase MutT (NUDIX family)|nr:pyrophosphohydrolase related protein [Cytophagaceae bacterium]
MQFAKKKVEKPTDNPWITLGSKEIYNNPWIQVRQDDILNPAGNKGIYGVVSFKNKAIGIIPVDESGYIYLVGQYRYTLNEYSWEIPEGGGPMNEAPIEAAKRELKEETGYTAAQWELLGRIHTSNSVTDEEGFLYLATGLTAGESEPEETEELAVKKVHLKEAVELVMTGAITDSLSMAAILMAARKLGY